VPGHQPVRGHQFVRVNLVGPGVDVNGDKLAFIAGFGMGADVALVDLVTAPSELLFTVAGL
jgi:hypothetical protein